MPERVRAFQQAKFGLLIHWGLYALPAQGEWVQYFQGTPADEYEAYAREFNPVEFDAAQ